MSSGVSGYEDYCGNRSLLECPYSVCDGCPIKERDKKDTREDSGTRMSDLFGIIGEEVVRE